MLQLGPYSGLGAMGGTGAQPLVLPTLFRVTLTRHEPRLAFLQSVTTQLVSMLEVHSIKKLA